MATPLGDYLNKIKANKSKIASVAHIKAPRMNDLCNDDTAKPYADELFPILYMKTFLVRWNMKKYQIACLKPYLKYKSITTEG